MTEPLPMLEAVGEVLAEMEGPQAAEAFKIGRSEPHGSWHHLVRFDRYVESAETFARLLALRGWRLVPIGVVNADEVVG